MKNNVDNTAERIADMFMSYTDKAFTRNDEVLSMLKNIKKAHTVENKVRFDNYIDSLIQKYQSKVIDISNL